MNTCQLILQTCKTFSAKFCACTLRYHPTFWQWSPETNISLVEELRGPLPKLSTFTWLVLLHKMCVHTVLLSALLSILPLSWNWHQHLAWEEPLNMLNVHTLLRDEGGLEESKTIAIKTIICNYFIDIFILLPYSVISRYKHVVVLNWITHTLVKWTQVIWRILLSPQYDECLSQATPSTPFPLNTVIIITHLRGSLFWMLHQFVILSKFAN